MFRGRLKETVAHLLQPFFGCQDVQSSLKFVRHVTAHPWIWNAAKDSGRFHKDPGFPELAVILGCAKQLASEIEPQCTVSGARLWSMRSVHVVRLHSS